MKTALKLAGAALIAFTASAEAQQLKIGLLTPSPLGETGWSRTLAEGVQAVKDKYGDDASVEIIENIEVGPEADHIINQMVANGDNLIVLGSFGYMNSGLKLAKRNPDVTILHASGFRTAPNFTVFAAKYFEGAYLMGMAAAERSKTGKLGVVSAFAIPELISTINGFTLGARSVNPEAEVNVIWINSWFDPAKAQSSARALVSQGADVLFSNSQDTPSVVTVGEEEGVYVFNLNSSMAQYAPAKYLGSVRTDWSHLFLKAAEQHLSGTFEGQNEWLGMADGAVIADNWSKDISPEMMAKIEAKAEAIKAGEFNVYSGPIRNQDGEEVVAEGEVLADDKIFSINWHVEGVTSPLPK